MTDAPLFASLKKPLPYTLIHSDCVEAMRLMSEASIDAIVCDPPYGISFMQADFDRLGDGQGQQEWHRRWAEQARRILKPGGHILAFGSPRTVHRLTSGIEDAGFEVLDQIIWLYGSGMPKSKGLLKPANEPVVLARKQVEKTIKANINKYGTGAINAESCRVPFVSDEDERESKNKNRHADFNSKPSNHGIYSPDNRMGSEKGNYNPPGRWPSDVIITHGAECVEGACSLGCPVLELESQSPGCSRFFYTAKPDKSERSEGLSERNTHICVKPIEMMRYLCRLVTPLGGVVLDPFMGSGSTGVAALREGFRFIGIEREQEYYDIAQQRIEHAAKSDS